jgi:hypothetical protein
VFLAIVVAAHTPPAVAAYGRDLPHRLKTNTFLPERKKTLVVQGAKPKKSSARKAELKN